MDIHRYPGPGAPPNDPHRASVLGEFGGLGLPVSGHTWLDDKNWGYRFYESREDLNEAYVTLLEELTPLVKKGLAAAIYTQTTDVEIEVNGFMTYDREIIKLDVNNAFNRLLKKGHNSGWHALMKLGRVFAKRHKA